MCYRPKLGIKWLNLSSMQGPCIGHRRRRLYRTKSVCSEQHAVHWQRSKPRKTICPLIGRQFRSTIVECNHFRWVQNLEMISAMNYCEYDSKLITSTKLARSLFILHYSYSVLEVEQPCTALPWLGKSTFDLKFLYWTGSENRYVLCYSISPNINHSHLKICPKLQSRSHHFDWGNLSDPFLNWKYWYFFACLSLLSRLHRWHAIEEPDPLN